MRLFLPILGLIPAFFLAACGGDTPPAAPKEYREKLRDPSTLSNFKALYYIDTGTLQGRELQPNPKAYDFKGLAELTYQAADRTAVLRLAACLSSKCEGPGGSVAVTSPTLRLVKATEKQIWFETAPGAVTAVSLWGEGLQNDGHPFAVAVTSGGNPRYDITGVQFPYE
jgi:hypothetical protein